MNHDGKKIGTTIRLETKIDAYYRTMAKSLNVSMQEAIALTLTGVVENQIIHRGENK